MIHQLFYSATLTRERTSVQNDNGGFSAGSNEQLTIEIQYRITVEEIYQDYITAESFYSRPKRI